MLSILAFLPIALMLAGDGVQWLSDDTIQVTATVAIDKPMEAFEKGEKVLQQVANDACKSKDLGKANILSLIHI